MVEERAPTSFMKYNAILRGGLVGACKGIAAPMPALLGPAITGSRKFSCAVHVCD